jgi:hypothetical protein
MIAPAEASSGGTSTLVGAMLAERERARFADDRVEVESAAIAPVSATGGAARVRLDGIGQSDQDPQRADASPSGRSVSGRTSWWRDKRSFGRRAVIALPVALAPTFLLFVFGPLDIYRRNQGEFVFTLGDFMGVSLAVFAGMAAITWLVLAVLRGRIFDVAASLVLGLALALWAQGTFLNTDLGPVNGDAVRWDKLWKVAIWDTAAWIGIVLAPLGLRLVARKAWTLVVWLAPTALVAALGMGLIGMLGEDQAPPPVRPDHLVPTYDGVFTASSANNQYLFLLDMMDQKFVEEIEATDPEFFSRHLDGFTEFKAHISNYSRTLPSAADMLTGERYQFDEPMEDYFARAYRDSDFLPGLRQAGYSTNIYATNRYSYYDISDIEGLADNLTTVETRTNGSRVIKGMLRLDALRYAPHLAKATFWPLGDPFKGTLEVTDRGEPFGNGNVEFFTKLHAGGLELAGEQPRFSFIHLDGAHNPARMDRNVQPVEPGSVSLSEQARGAFQIVFDYIAELKRIGAYEDATIVITADHGHWLDADWESLPQPRLTALFVKVAGAAGTPLTYNDSPTDMVNVRATFLADAGLEPADPTVFEIDDPAAVQRDFYYRRGQSLETGLIEHWRVTGDAREWTNWELIDTWSTTYWG